MTDLQRDIYEQKYRFEDETFDEFLNRVSDGDLFIKEAIRKQEFMPAGRILAGMDLYNRGRKVTLSNCYVLPKVEDNIESIFDTAKYLARTYSYGGGCGVAVSQLRPAGAKVNNAAATTSGATSFMELYSMVTELIGMKGRRGALMINMDIEHPDIKEFITIKSDLDKVTGANISVNATDKFFEAVENDEMFELRFEVEATGEAISEQVRARELLELIAHNNWDYAEPGLLFSDRINSWHLMSEDEEFEFAGVNPCAEETLPAFGSCNLSSINLSELVINPFTEDAEFDYDRFDKLIRAGVRYLNHVLDINMELHPLKEQREMSRDYRQIGLGIMGLADMFIKLGVRYGSDESLELIDKIGFKFIDTAIQESAYLAGEFEPFPAMNINAILKSDFLNQNTTKETRMLVERHGLRNSQITTIAPTGSISTMIGCSNGVEPIFRVAYTRKTESLNDGKDTFYTVVTPIIEELMKVQGIKSIDDLPEYVVTAETLEYMDRLRVQAKWQEYIDASISSTVNLPNEATVEDVENLYYNAWKLGLKGVTVYRDGCARGGILITEDSKSKADKIQELQQEMNRLIGKQLLEDPNTCPMCGGELIHSGGCSECQDCGYSPCSI